MPILAFRNHMIPLCPPDRTVDVRKSSYKKMGKFLNEMQKVITAVIFS